MSSTIIHCPSCGRALDSAPGTLCPQCQTAFQFQPENLSDGSPPTSPSASNLEPPPSSPWLDLFWAFLIWGISGAFLLGLDAALRLALWLANKEIPKVEISRGFAIISLALTLVMQLAALIASWVYVTRFGKKPFFSTLGWRWHPQFKWVHAVALAMLMFGLGILLSKFLPHRETELEKILKMGMLIRVMVAVLAVITAPLVEEVIYRGVVYSAAERIGGTPLGVGLVTFIFALVHVPQYWGSVAAITAIVSLSLVLTLLRAWTGSLLPCVATHFVYNGVQAVFLLLAPEKALETVPQHSATAAASAFAAAPTLLSQWLGLN